MRNRIAINCILFSPHYCTVIKKAAEFFHHSGAVVMGVDMEAPVPIRLDENRLAALFEASRPEHEVVLQRQQHGITR